MTELKHDSDVKLIKTIEKLHQDMAKAPSRLLAESIAWYERQLALPREKRLGYKTGRI